jgi:hypothetical protein
MQAHGHWQSVASANALVAALEAWHGPPAAAPAAWATGFLLMLQAREAVCRALASSSTAPGQRVCGGAMHTHSGGRPV